MCSHLGFRFGRESKYCPLIIVLSGLFWEYMLIVNTSLLAHVIIQISCCGFPPSVLSLFRRFYIILQLTFFSYFMDLLKILYNLLFHLIHWLDLYVCCFIIFVYFNSILFLPQQPFFLTSFSHHTCDVNGPLWINWLFSLQELKFSFFVFSCSLLFLFRLFS